LSPSRLQTYTNCERKFFFQRILRIDEPGSIYLEVGSVFHEVLKELIPVGANSGEVRAALRSDATEIIDRAITKIMPGAGEWLRELTHVHMRLMLDGVHALEERRDGEYHVLSVETSASYPSEEDAVLTGRLDRIDDVEGLGPVVVDYKTSKSLSKTAASIIKEIEEDRDHWQVSVYSALAGALGHPAQGFLYYVVPPGEREKLNAVGVQLSGGRVRELIRRTGREKPRYDVLPAETLRAVFDDAMTIHAGVLAGACAYDRTDDPDNCKNCHFIRVCRRNGG
ncbi:MAG TPA: PD-(D/E)XK nuclease family protein, partial [Candidatus Krumholzibacteria bacterium]